MSQPTQGRITALLTRCQDLLAASPAWQDWCGSAAAAQHQVALIASDDDQHYPQIILDLAPGLIRTRTDVAGEPFTTTASVLVYFLIERDAAVPVADAVTGLWNRCEAVLADLGLRFDAQGQGALMTAAAVEDGPRLVRAKDLNRARDQVDILWSLAVTNWP